MRGEAHLNVAASHLTEPYLKTVKNVSAIPDYVSQCLQLALLLEVSAHPKPGNVHRTADFQETRYEHFLASAAAVSPHFRHAAKQGIKVFNKEITLSQIAVGKNIKNAVTDVANWQRDKNTLLGSIILLSPMATAAGLTLAEDETFSANKFRANLNSVVKSTTPEDAVNVYDTITLAQPGGLGKAPRLDVTNSGSKQKILKEGVSLFEVFKISAPWDSISSEWVKGFSITFDIGYPYLKQQLEQTRDINTATVHTFLKVLSQVPDTLIARKAGKAKAHWVSTEAKKALYNGGLTTQKGRNSLSELDQKLHDFEHRLNPGTTADIMSAILAVVILNGYRP